MMFDFGSLISGVVGNLFGGQKAPEQSPISPSDTLNPAPAPDPVQPSPPPPGLAGQMRTQGREFMADFLDDATRTARSAVFSPIQSKIAGKSRKNFNDSAFPGTTPWEQLGGGNAEGGSAYADMARQSEELAQRERESTRSSSTQLTAARMGVGERIAAIMLQQGADPADAADILLKTGAFPPGEGMRLDTMTREHLGAQIGQARAATTRSDEMLPIDKAGGLAKNAQTYTETQRTAHDIDRIDAETARITADTSLKEMQTLLAPVETAFKGLQVVGVTVFAGMLKGALSRNPRNPSRAREEVSADLYKRGVPEGDIFELLEYVEPFMLGGPSKGLPAPPKGLPKP